MKWCGMFLTLLLSWAVISFGQPSLSSNQPSKQMMPARASSMPLSFAENVGQFGEKTLFKAQTGGATFFFCKDEVAYLFVRNTNEPDKISEEFSSVPLRFRNQRFKKESMLIKAQFVGANPNATATGVERLPNNSNYFFGNNPSKWHTDVANYASIEYKDIYPGIDLKYHGNGNSMKYDFIVNPGSDPSQIQIYYDGVENLGISNNGDLEAQTSFGPIYEKAPYIYQEIDGTTYAISGRYGLIEGKNFGFVVEGGYNPNYALIIDPELVYSTYLGGEICDIAGGIGVLGDGSVIIAGVTWSSYFPTLNPYQMDQGADDVFVTKLSPDGNSLIYSTYIGGSGSDYCMEMSVDVSGYAYVTGLTESSDYPTVNPYQTQQGAYDGFVTKLSAAGNSLIYSTYLGGANRDYGHDIAVDGSGSAYIVGQTLSSNFPTVNPIEGSFNGGIYDAFVTKFSPDGSFLEYSTYLGGSGLDYGFGIAIDQNGNAYVTGETDSPDFPTINPYQTVQPNLNAFVSKLSPNGSTLIYSTYLGGNADDVGGGIAVDLSGSAYITGYTLSANFPTLNPFQTYQGECDGFVAKFSPAGNSLVYSTYLGGDTTDTGVRLVVDADEHAHIIGYSWSGNFPTLDSYQIFHGMCDAIVTELSADGSSLISSTYLGGDGVDVGVDIAIDGNGNTYITGYTESTDFPTLNPYQSVQPGYASFVAKLYDAPPGSCWRAAIHSEGEVIGDAIHSSNVVIGVCPNESTIPAPPPPPEYTVLSQLWRPDWSGPYYQDIRQTRNDSTYEWQFDIDPHGNVPPPSSRCATISWNPDSLSQDMNLKYILIDDNGRIAVPDMRTISQYQVCGAGSRIFKIRCSPETCIDINLASGWNLISLPVTPDTTTLSYLFPSATAAFEYTDRYLPVNSLEPCRGYWIRVPGADTVMICGQEVGGCSKPLTPQWSLEGGPNCCIQPPASCGTVTTWGFSGGYQLDSLLCSGRGYWIKVSNDCAFDLECGNLPLTSGHPAEQSSNITSGIILHAQGEDLGGIRDCDVIIGVDSRASTILAPPASPEYSAKMELYQPDWAGPFYEDIRESGSASYYWVIAINPHGNINPPNERTSVLSWDPAQFGEGEYILRQGSDNTGPDVVADMKAVTQYQITGTNQDYYFSLVHRFDVTGVEDGRPTLPLEYCLHQSYPNPFNPTTMIQFDLPQPSQVRLVVYDMLGREVRTLVNGVEPAGYHKLIWDGTDAFGNGVPSGIYFYRLAASRFSKTMKMTLIR